MQKREGNVNRVNLLYTLGLSNHYCRVILGYKVQNSSVTLMIIKLTDRLLNYHLLLNGGVMVHRAHHQPLLGYAIFITI